MNAIPQEQPSAYILECTEKEYHADPCPTPSLSSSIAKVLLSKSPKHAWQKHPQLGGMPVDDEDGEEAEKESFAKTRGKVIHSLLLGKGADIYVCDVDAFRSKAAKEMRDEALAAGKVPIVARKFSELYAAAQTIKGNLLGEFGIDLDAPGGESEVTIVWQEQGADGPVLCRCRMDRVYINSGMIFDVKSIHSADPDTCGKQAVEYGRDIQDASYRSALAHLRPDLAGRIDMLFLHVETEPPYAIYPGPLDGELRELGRQRWERAVLLWEECLKRDRWPAYTDRVTPIQGPGYAITRWMEKAQSW